MIDLIQGNIDELKALCSKHAVYELYAFGSSVSDSFNESSDLDFAVLFKESLDPVEHGDAFFGFKDDL